MEYSVQAYLKRVPTNKLGKFLQDYQANQHKEDFSSVIGDVMGELARRKEEESHSP